MNLGGHLSSTCEEYIIGTQEIWVSGGSHRHLVLCLKRGRLYLKEAVNGPIVYSTVYTSIARFEVFVQQNK